MNQTEEILLIKDMQDSGFDDAYILSILAGEVEPVRDRPNYDDIH